MFVFVQNDLINANHIVSCTPTSGVTVIVLVTGRRITVSTADFEANILPCLPMLLKPLADIPILNPEEVQIAPVTEEEVLKVMPEIPAEDPQEAKPRSRSSKSV